MEEEDKNGENLRMQGENDGCWKVICQKGSFSILFLRKVLWLGEAEVPANYYTEFSQAIYRIYFFFFNISKLLDKHSLPANSRLHAPSCKINSADISTGSKRRRIVATARRPSITQQLIHCNASAQYLSFCIYIYIFFFPQIMVLIEHPFDGNREQTKHAYRFRYLLYFFSFSPSLFPFSF